MPGTVLAAGALRTSPRQRLNQSLASSDLMRAGPGRIGHSSLLACLDCPGASSLRACHPGSPQQRTGGFMTGQRVSPLLLALWGAVAFNAQGQTTPSDAALAHSKVDLIVKSSHHDLSPPLRDIAVIAPSAKRRGRPVREHRIPFDDGPELDADPLLAVASGPNATASVTPLAPHIGLRCRRAGQWLCRPGRHHGGQLRPTRHHRCRGCHAVRAVGKHRICRVQQVHQGSGVWPGRWQDPVGRLWRPL
jgi:hypothetical protein